MIDTESPPGSWAKHLATMAERQAAARLITARNDRIKASKAPIDTIAMQEGVGLDYVRRVKGMFGR